MPEINIDLPLPLNASVQEGDIAYYVPLEETEVGGFQVPTNQEPIEIGIIQSITMSDGDSDGILDTATLLCEIDDGVIEPSLGDYVFFAKDRAVNETSILGYYAKFKFVNDSKQKAEMFAASCDVSENSK